jgi:putative ATP-dependent endonuclease of the OLD family
MKLFAENKPIAELLDLLRGSDENQKIVNAIGANNTWSDEDKKKGIIAARYLNSVGKGENALELNYVLENNLKDKTPVTFNVPIYIKEAINWICQ